MEFKKSMDSISIIAQSMQNIAFQIAKYKAAIHAINVSDMSSKYKLELKSEFMHNIRRLNNQLDEYSKKLCSICTDIKEE